MPNKTVLLVEDNPDDVTLTLRAFRQHDVQIEVVVARDGLEALDYLFCMGAFTNRDVGNMPKLVLLDLKLPKIDGKDVLRRIRGDERTCLLPVVVLTSSREKQDLTDCYTLGANSYICKPIDYEQFVEAVRQLDLYWLVLNETPSHNGVSV